MTSFAEGGTKKRKRDISNHALFSGSMSSMASMRMEVENDTKVEKKKQVLEGTDALFAITGSK